MGREYLERPGNMVVRFFPPGTPREAVERELRIAELVRQYGLEAPFVHGIVESGGRLGIEFDKVIGPTFTEWMLEHIGALVKLTSFFAFEQHEIHMHRIPELPALQERLEAQIRSTGLPSEVKDRAVDQMRRMPDQGSVLNWEYHPENIRISLDGPIVLDWGGAARGDPLADVARTSLLLQLWNPGKDREVVDRIRERFHQSYVLECMKIYGRPDEDLEAWRLPVAAARLAEGVPGEREHLLEIIRSGR